MLQKNFKIWICCLLISTHPLHAQELTLWYNKAAQKWVEALPIGNGRLGAMVFGGIKQERIQFNEETLWTGYPRDYNKKGAYKYLDSIRNFLFAGKQKEAEELAGREFMGLKSNEGDKEAWQKKTKSILQLKQNPSKPDYNDASWPEMNVPNYNGWEAEGFDGLDGAVWFRTTFDLPASWLGKDLKLDLNRITDEDYSYVNGILVGTQNKAEPRVYTIPKNILKKGKNTISVLVLNYTSKGGILGYKETSKHIGIYPTDAADAEKISLNGKWKYFIQDDAPPSTGQYQAAYQPFGDVLLNFNLNETKITNYRRSLDLNNAVAITTYSLNGVDYKREYIASTPHQVIAVHLSANKKNSISFEIELNSPHKNSIVKQIDKNTLSLSVKVKDGQLTGISYLKVLTKNAAVSIDKNKITVANSDDAIIYITAATNYKNYKDISANPVAANVLAMKKIKTLTWQQIKSAHIKEYQKYFNTFSLKFYTPQLNSSNKQATEKGIEGDDFPTDERLARFATFNNPSFVALYAQYGRYLLISSSRPGTNPANLQGIWNDLLSPPWGSKYTTNINAEMNYWPAELLNLSPMHQPLFQMIKDLSETGKKTAKQYYQAPGWVLHHNTDLWRGTAPINASNHGIWVTGGAWLCDHLWEHYLFSQNLKFLRDTAYPIMKQAALFFNSFLINDPSSGYLISTPSNSPEHGGLVAGPSMDHQIIRALFKNTIAAAAILNVDSPLREELQNKYSKIAPNKIGRHGQLQEWMQDEDDTTDKHRHVSHLWAVYPGNEINWDETPELMRAARQSLIYRGDEATGWSLGWKINLWARFRDAEHTYKLIQMLLSPAKGGAGSYPNLFDAHPPFQIDGNFGGAAGIGEMLLQSHTNYIDILPALPRALADGDVKGIKARGGFELDMSWRNGLLQSLTIRSTAGQLLVLKYRDKEIKLRTLKGGMYKFNGLLQKK